jgi:translation initiation factor 1
MSKRKKGKKEAGPAAAPTSALAHNPFASLAGLGEGLPPGETEAVAEPAPDPEPNRFPKKLVVRMEKKGRRGKTVTRISGIPGREIQALTGRMKKALGCGAVVEDGELVLQGSLVDRAASWLEKEGATQIVKGN